MKNRITAGFAVLLLTVMSAITVITTTPAQAAVSAIAVMPAQTAPSTPSAAADCDPFNTNDAHCTYTNALATGATRRYQPLLPRNVCTDAHGLDGVNFRSYTNETNYIHWQFNSHLCNGSHWVEQPFSTGATTPATGHGWIIRTALTG